MIDHLDAYSVDEWQCYSVIPEDKGYLGAIAFPREDPHPYGALSLERHILQRKLIDFAEKLGVPVHWGYELDTLEQNDTEVSVTFTNTTKESFSFVIGCDGLHSNARKALFGDQPAVYTGLCMVMLLLTEY